MRVVKTLVLVGRPRKRDDLHRRPIGAPIEIVLLDDPAALDVGDRLRAHALLDGRPLPSAWLTAYVRDAAGRVIERRLRADRSGTAVFPVEQTMAA